MQVNIQKRNPKTDAAESEVQQWNPKETAIVICDMWNQHWCKGATARVAEMAPVMNGVLKAARDKGVTIIHAPSGCMGVYADHSARKRALEIKPAPVVREVLAGESWSGGLTTEKNVKVPIDAGDGGCDCTPHCKQGSPWKSEIATLEIDENKDLISDEGVLIGSFLKRSGIKNVILMGVHTNMCVIGRPFGLRQQFRLGNNVVLMRDMTDTMYNHERPPHVSHFKGTDLMIEYIEKYVCPTVLSTDFTGEKRFEFAGTKTGE
ncbi:hypothetical protein FACS189419_04390 [Planctomycetales bacterium]|nr:hypothetical protein FACS189419_04390 [Planctomycetales bacterium]